MPRLRAPRQTNGEIAGPPSWRGCTGKASFLRERSGRGALELDTPELKLKFDEQGRVAALVEYPRNDAHRLIEDYMIAANVAAAKSI